MDNMHPAMIQALQGFAPPAESAEMAEYRKKLRQFDWSFEFSDDGEVYRRGRKALDELLALQAVLDPDGSIWIAMAPGCFGEPKPVVKDNTEIIGAKHPID